MRYCPLCGSGISDNETPKCNKCGSDVPLTQKRVRNLKKPSDQQSENYTSTYSHNENDVDEFSGGSLGFSMINNPMVQKRKQQAYANYKRIISEIKNELNGKLSITDVALNLASGTGKEHMAILSALLQLGVGIRLIGVTKEGIQEI